MSLLARPKLLRAENRLILLFDRTFQKAANVRTLNYSRELPANVKRWFGSAIFAKQLDQILTEIIKQSILYADGQMKILTAASTGESTILTTEAVRMSKELSAEVSESIVRMLDNDAIYYQHPNKLAKRIEDLWGGERYKAVRFARTFTADVATASAVHRYRQYGVRYMEFDAKIDDRTSDQCRCLDGTIFDLEKGSVDAYRPPLHHHCLVAGTKIVTSSGDKNIKDIKIGDKVLTHLGHYMPVTETMSRFPEKLIDLHTSSYHVRITPNHPILLWDMYNGVYKWVEAGNLNVDDMVCTVNGYEFVLLVQECEPEQVYNISVQEDESYIANGIVVHNCRSDLVPLPITEEIDESRIYENRDFSDALKDPAQVDKAFQNIDKFNEKYRVSKYVLDQDLQARIMFEKGAWVGVEGPALGESAEQIVGKGRVDDVVSLEGTIRAHEADIRDMPQEHCFAFSSEGVIVLKKSGTVNQIDISLTDIPLLKGTIFTHNHPSGSSFSAADIRTACKVGLKEIRATGKYRTYIMRIVDGGNFREEMWDKISPVYDLKNEVVRNEFWAKIGRGELTPEEASVRHAHEVWSRTAKEISSIEYTYIEEI